MKITFSNGEEVEWTGANLPDHVSIHFNPPAVTPVPDQISADHIESLCNMLLSAMKYAVEHDPSPFSISKYDRYHSAIYWARQRAKWLREGKP